MQLQFYCDSVMFSTYIQNIKYYSDIRKTPRTCYRIIRWAKENKNNNSVKYQEMNLDVNAFYKKIKNNNVLVSTSLITIYWNKQVLKKKF